MPEPLGLAPTNQAHAQHPHKSTSPERLPRRGSHHLLNFEKTEKRRLRKEKKETKAFVTTPKGVCEGLAFRRARPLPTGWKRHSKRLVRCLHLLNRVSPSEGSCIDEQLQGRSRKGVTKRHQTHLPPPRASPPASP